MKQAAGGIPNPLQARDPDLVHRLAEFRVQVNDMLLDKFVTEKLNDPARRIKDGLHPLGDLKATAIVLRILTN
jgi:hypothetical protein